jgi:hypothetical protein
MDVIRLIMGVSAERGVELTHYVTRPVNSDPFIDFLNRIDHSRTKPCYVFMDNASYHTSVKTKNRLN